MANGSFLNKYNPLPDEFTGKPQTKEGMNYLMDYINRTGQAPPPAEVSSFERMKGESYAPGSTMYELGWRSPQEYTRSEWARGGGETPYGVHTGEQVPAGGAIITDQYGNPLFRTFDIGGHAREIEQGRFIERPEGFSEMEMLELGLPYTPQQRFERPTGEFYPQPAQPYKSPSYEEALGQFSPQERYLARLKDWLPYEAQQRGNEEMREVSSHIANIRTLIQSYEEQKKGLSGENLTALENAINQQVQQEEKAIIDLLPYWNGQEGQQLADMISKKYQNFQSETLQQAQGMMYQVGLEQLPLYEQAVFTSGPQSMQLAQQGYEKAYNQYLESLPPEYRQPTAANEPIMSQREYLDLITTSGLPPEVADWLRGQYYNLIAQYRNTGQEKEFDRWLWEYLAGG